MKVGDAAHSVPLFRLRRLVIREEQENQYQEKCKCTSVAKETAKASHFYPPFLIDLILF